MCQVTTSHLQLPAAPRAFTSPRPVPHRGGAYLLRLAASRADVIAAQSLRHTVFALEMGALTPGPPGLDADEFDDLSDQLILWHRSPEQPPEAVGTYRLFPPHRNNRYPRGPVCPPTGHSVSCRRSPSWTARSRSAVPACGPITAAGRQSRCCGGVSRPTWR